MSYFPPQGDDQTTYTPQPHTQYPPPPYLPPPPPKKKRPIWLWIVIVIAILIVLGQLGKAMTSSQPSTSTSPAATEQPTYPPLPTLIPTQAPTQPLVWTTTMKFSGNGSKKTPTFTVSDNWRIAWSCNPASAFGGSYNMIITVENPDGSIADSGVNSMCQKGNTHDTTNVPAGGTFLLDILSEGDWVIQVQELQ